MKERTPKVAIYTRVSTETQAEEGDSLDIQERELAGYTRYAFGIEDYEPFAEKGKSGKDMVHREVFQEMMTRVRAGEFTHILVYKLDRLSRSVMDILQLFEEMKRLDVQIVSKTDHIDTSTAAGRMMVTMLSALAQMEREQTADRVRDTMIGKAKRGDWNGGHVPMGYTRKALVYQTKEGVRTLVTPEVFSVKEDEAEVIRLVYDTYLQERSVAEVCRILNGDGYTTRAGKPWVPTTVWQILKNPWYCGDYRYNHIRAQDGGKRTRRMTGLSSVIITSRSLTVTHGIVCSRSSSETAATATGSIGTIPGPIISSAPSCGATSAICGCTGSPIVPMQAVMSGL